MNVKRLLTALILLLVIFNYLSNVEAQDDTFGPICDDITVTCVPTETPTVTATLAPGAPSSTPAATATVIPVTSLTVTPSLTPVGQGGVAEPPPEELLRAGISDYQNFFILLAALLLSVGLFSKLLPWAVRK